jgi:hypothetical protein
LSSGFASPKKINLLLLDKSKSMEAVTIIRDKENNHRVMQIDLDLLAKDEELLEDVYDMIAVELRKDEETIPWEQAKQQFPQDDN